MKRGTLEFADGFPDKKPPASHKDGHTRGQHRPQRLTDDLETVRVRTLEQENERLRGELAEMKETTDIYKQVISDYTGKSGGK